MKCKFMCFEKSEVLIGGRDENGQVVHKVACNVSLAPVPGEAVQAGTEPKGIFQLLITDHMAASIYAVGREYVIQVNPDSPLIAIKKPTLIVPS